MQYANSQQRTGIALHYIDITYNSVYVLAATERICMVVAFEHYTMLHTRIHV